MSSERPPRDERRRSVAPGEKPSGGSYSVAPGASSDAPAVEYLSAPRSLRMRAPVIEPYEAPRSEPKTLPPVASAASARTARVPDLDLESVRPPARRTSEAPPDMELEGLIERGRLSEPPPLPVVYPSERPPAASAPASVPPGWAPRGRAVSERPPSTRRAAASESAPVARRAVASEAPPPNPVAPRHSTRPPGARIISVLSPGRAEPSSEWQVQAFLPPTGWSLPSSLMPQGEAERTCDELLGKLGQGCLVLAVTSEPGRRAVKSSVAAQLAVGVAAARSARVLLLEGDMARPHVHRSIEAEMATSTGFTQQLQAKVQAGVSRQWSVLGCSRTLHVLAEGRFRSPEMLRSPQFAEALGELRERYDLIVIDGPSIDAPSEMRVLRREADTVVFAVGSEAERASAIEQGTTLFGASLLTVAANS